MKELSDLIHAGHVQALIFDCDGTIAHSMPLHHQAWVEALSHWNCTLTFEQHEAWAGQPTRKIIERLNEMHGLSMPVDEVMTRKESFYLSQLTAVKPVPKVLEAIQNYQSVLPMSVVSGSPRESVFKTLGALNVRDKFKAILGAEDYSQGKPSPEGFLSAARQMETSPSQCLVFEDGHFGIQAARAAGMFCIQVFPEKDELILL